MKRVHLFSLIEGYLEGTLTAAEREELASAVASDPSIRERFVGQVRLARRVRAALRPRAATSTWEKIASLTTPQEPARRQQIADRIDAVLDQDRRARRSAALVWGGAGLAAAAAVAFLVVRPDRDREEPPPAVATGPETAREVPAPASGPLASSSPPPLRSAAGSAPTPALPTPPPGLAPPSPATQPMPADPRARLAAEMVAAGEPALAARGDVLQYLGFDVPRPLQAVRGRLRPRFTGLVTGLHGSGLRVYFHRDQAGLPGGGARAFIAASALTETEQASRPRDELHLRYHVRLSESFDFAGGGVLPGLCLGGCGEGRGAARPRGEIIRPRWTPFGELVIDPLPGTRPRDGRWQRALGRGSWHAIELRVKLNTPGAADGTVEGWLDGVRGVALTGLRLRDTEATGLQGVWFQTMFRPGGPAPARDGDITFDNLAVATGYLGPRSAP